VARVAVAGTTSWGTTLAVLLARGAHDVLLWARSEAEAQLLQSERENPRHRPGLRFPGCLEVIARTERLAETEMLVLAVPSAALRANLERLSPHIRPGATLLSATKGIEPETCLRVSEVVAECGIEPERILALSGPNFAGEIAAGLPAASVVAGSDPARVRRVQALLNGPSFRVYSSDDVCGVELCGSLKNLLAIACGISDGLGYGENAKAALITRGLAEITRLGLAAGARATTCLGLAGIGDVILTCQSNLSRNRRLGLALAGGLSLKDALASVEGVVEGAVTARATPLLAKRFGVEMPICEGLYRVLYEGLDPREAVSELMSRDTKAEFE
jgi:glycerol-3-phosphate dehydrogenase (NAD(P)+)